MTQPADGGAPRKRSGVPRILIVFASLGAIAWLAIGGLIYARYKQDPEARQMLDGVAGMYREIFESQFGEEVRALKELGCEGAAVMTFPDDEQTAIRFVTCTVALWGTPPSCDQVARRFLEKAAPSHARVFVTVTQVRQVCQSTYSPEGTLVEAPND